MAGGQSMRPRLPLYQKMNIAKRIHLFLRANDFRNENLLGWDDTRWSGYVLGTI
jgi:hypothetical protein